MADTAQTAPFKYEQKLREGNLRFKLAEADDFYGRRGSTFKALRELDRRLRDADISYALLGAMAMTLHGHERMTVDIDVLMTPENLEKFRQQCLGRGYVPAFRGARKAFRETEYGVRVEVVASGEYPGDGKPKPVAFPDPAQSATEIEGMSVVTLTWFIQLKLASGLSAAHRMKDLTDVLETIRALKLPEQFADELDASVTEKYLELWRAAQEPDVHEQGDNS